MKFQFSFRDHAGTSLPAVRINRSAILLIAFIMLYLLAVTLSFGINYEPWGDEGHFLNTIVYFGSSFQPSTLTDYEEVTPPLTFIVYAAWGKLFGFEKANLRVFSLLIAAMTFLIYLSELLSILKKPLVAFAALCVLLLNPYTFGLSLFVFTDMLMLLCLVLFLSAVRRENNTLLFLSAASGLLVRQYFLFVVLGGVVFYLFRSTLKKDRKSSDPIWMLVLAILPLTGLMILWKGPAPPYGLSRWIPTNAELFTPNAITLYVGLIFVTVLPLVVLKWKRLIFPSHIHLLLLGCSFLYFLFPVQPSEVTLESGRQTVGLFHRALMAVLPSSQIIHAVFYCCFLVGLHVLAGFAREVGSLFRARDFSFMFFLHMLVAAFFLVMPFSYQVWEKYALPLVPIVSLCLLMNSNKDSMSQAPAV